MLPVETEHLAAGALVAALVAGALLAALHLLSPEFVPSTRYVSEYALGRYGALMQVAFISLGAAVLLVAVAEVRGGNEGGVLLRLAPGLILAAAAVCLAGLAVFSTDASTEPIRTREGAVHNELARVGFWLLAAGMLCWSALRVGTSGGAVAWASLAVAVLAVGALVALRYAALDGPAGAVQRVLIVAIIAWLATASLAIVRLDDGSA